MNLYDEFFKIIEAIENKNLPYAVVGGLAMAFHDKPRFTQAIDIMILPANLDSYRALLKDLDYADILKLKKIRNSLQDQADIENLTHD